MKHGFFGKAFLSVLLLAFIGIQAVVAKDVIPCGNSIGVTLELSGCLVVSVGSVESGGGTCSPAKSAGIKAGDVITVFNGCAVSSVEDLSRIADEVGAANAQISIVRGGKTHELTICPCAADEGGFKIGAWVKDALSGIGTLTFVEPETMRFGALGHGIVDSDSGTFAEIDGGKIYKSLIVSVVRGSRGEPGELRGVFSENGGVFGTVSGNGLLGLYGKAEENLSGELAEVAPCEEVSEGAAYILANVERDTVGEFSVEITHIEQGGGAKALTIKVTDPYLIQKTGGIVQGMSGSPIMQNGKLVGAVTHVFVNDPTKGYGIFAETMLDEAMCAE